MTPTWSAYLTKVHDLFKFSLYNYLKVANPEHMPENKFIFYGQYITKLEMVLNLHCCLLHVFCRIFLCNIN